MEKTSAHKSVFCRSKLSNELSEEKGGNESLIHFRERYFGDSYILCKSKQDEKSIVFRSFDNKRTQTFTVWKHMRCQRNPKPYHYVENVGTSVTHNHPSYFILQCMKIGMIRSISDFANAAVENENVKYIIDTVMPVEESIAEKHLRPKEGFLRSMFGCFGSYMNLYPRDMSTNAIMSRSDISSEELQDGNNRVRFRFHFVAHFCKLYSEIRSILRYTSKPIMEELASDDWSSTPTPGKSNSLLFFCGPKWVLKTMTAAEVLFLRQNLLPEYRSHFAEYPETLLPHFLGHFTLIIKSGFGGFKQKISFLLMRNMVPVPRGIDCDLFDLKGSFVDRSTGTERSERVLKDLDLKYKVHIINEAARKKILSQCAADVDFLQRMGIMDYSLLLGVFRSSTDGSHEIVIGFVDILQRYTLHKRFERFLKSLVFDRRLISCAPPKDYSERFLKYIESIFV